jgi:hypothetical protein
VGINTWAERVAMISLWQKFILWLENKSSLLSSWASLIQIIFFPAIVITLLTGYYQLEQYYQKPDLHLKFQNPKALQYYLANISNTVAEQPLYCFGLFDLDAIPIETVPVPCKEISYLKGAQGPNNFMERYGKNGHRYFGFATITCKNCDMERWYWIFLVHNSDANAWFVELNKNEPKLWDPISLLKDPNGYIEKNFPINKRKPIDKKIAYKELGP